MCLGVWVLCCAVLCCTLGALAWTNYSPKLWWGRRLVAAAQPLLPVASADELLLLLHSLLSLRLSEAAPPGWVHEAYSHLARQQQGLGLSQLADAAHVLGSMQLPQELVQAHRWVAVDGWGLLGVGWAGVRVCLAADTSDVDHNMHVACECTRNTFKVPNCLRCLSPYVLRFCTCCHRNACSCFTHTQDLACRLPAA